MATQTKVKLEGASQYKKDLANIAQQAKTLAAEMKATASAFDGATRSQEKEQAVTEKLNKQIETQQAYIAKLKQAIEAESKASGENSTQTLKLKEQLAKAETELNGMKTAVANVGKEQEKSKKKTFDFGEALKANIASEAVTKLVEGLANAVKKVASGIKEAYTGSVKWADDLATLSVQTGISTDALQEYQYMSGLVDVSVDTITGSLTRLKRNMASAKSGTGAAAEKFARLGVAVTDGNGELRNAQTVFDELITALANIDNETERDAIAMDIFGKSAQELNPLIEAGAETIAAFREEAHATGYVMQTDVIKSLVSSADETDRTTARFSAFKRELSAGLAPQITELQKTLLDLFSEIDLEKVRENISGIVSRFGDFVKWCKQNKDVIIALFAGIAAGFAAFEVGSIIASVIQLMQQFATVQAAVNAVMAANPIGAVAVAVAALVAGIVLLVKNWDVVKAKANEVWNTLKTDFGALFTEMGAQFKAFGEGIKNAIIGVKDGIANWVNDSIINPVKDKISAFVDIGKNLITGLWNGINDKVQWIKDKISGFCDNVKEWFQNFFGIHSPSRETAWMGEMLVAGLAQGISGGTGAITTAWSNATAGIGVPTATAAGASAVGGGVVNIYAQQIDESTIDYVYNRINRRMGVM